MVSVVGCCSAAAADDALELALEELVVEEEAVLEPELEHAASAAARARPAAAVPTNRERGDGDIVAPFTFLFCSSWCCQGGRCRITA
jgi:hypothetical protein